VDYLVHNSTTVHHGQTIIDRKCDAILLLKYLKIGNLNVIGILNQLQGHHQVKGKKERTPKFPFRFGIF
jgi:hypothetical protein